MYGRDLGNCEIWRWDRGFIFFFRGCFFGYYCYYLSFILLLVVSGEWIFCVGRLIFSRFNLVVWLVIIGVILVIENIL